MAKALTIFLFLLSFLASRGEAICFQGLDFHPLPGFYMGVLGGLNGGYELKCDLKTNRGYYWGIKTGRKFSPFLRFEGEFLWQNNTPHSFKVKTIQFDHVHGKINIWSLMVNAFVDLNWEFPMRPFMGVGLGYAQADGHWDGSLRKYFDPFLFEQKKIKHSFDKRGLAFQLILGLKYFIHPRLEASLEYRFFDIESHLSNHKLGLALTQFF